MNEPIGLASALAAGILFGGMFYGGLWWTVRKGMLSERVAAWFIGSLLVRLGGALLGIYLVGAGHWQRLLPCLLGFVMARLIVTWLVRTPAIHPAPQSAEDRHAP
ncbi:MAG: ATPase F0F1 [Betaproteobacteria bacterium RIFCSPLOWO2_02_FULL_63_19]|nr:MAG: ATPase F0F1 [Betaproteobacteria bacterium RIFCSPLOWO2_02_FULL_63_19]